MDGFSNQEPFVVYQQDSNYGFYLRKVVDQEKTLLGQYYSNTGELVDTFKITKNNKIVIILFNILYFIKIVTRLAKLNNSKNFPIYVFNVLCRNYIEINYFEIHIK